jgi:hypothetical protein
MIEKEMFTSLSPDSKLIAGCHPDCPLLDSCRAQKFKRCPMQVKAVTISLPLVNSLLLHAVVVALVLMLPIYGGSAGQRPLMSYLVFLTNGEGYAPSHDVTATEKHRAVGKIRTQEKPAPEKVVAPKKKAETGKAAKTPLKNVSPRPMEKAAPAAVSQKVPPKTENVKTDTEMAKEVVKEPEETVKALQNAPPKTEDVAAAEMAEEEVTEPAETKAEKKVEEREVSSALATSQTPPESSVPSRSTGAPPVPGTEQFMKELLPDTGALLSYQGGSEVKTPGAGEKKEAPEGAVAKQTGAADAAPSSPAAEATPATAPGGQQVAEEGVSPTSGKGGETGKTGPTGQPQAADQERKAPIGISGAAALLPRDILIRVVVAGEDGSSLFTRLSRRNYSPSGLENVGGKDSPVKTKEENGSAGGALVKRVLSVVNADKGIYTFVIGNAGRKTCVVNAVFLLFEKTKRERTKEYKVIQLAPGTGVKFKFLVPDAIFWDDDERFTGSMEDSDSITKFNSDTGLVWKESKDD